MPRIAHFILAEIACDGECKTGDGCIVIYQGVAHLPYLQKRILDNVARLRIGRASGYKPVDEFRRKLHIMFLDCHRRESIPQTDRLRNRKGDKSIFGELFEIPEKGLKIYGIIVTYNKEEF